MSHHLVLIPTIVFAIITYLSAFKDGKPTCDKYILNTYLYSVTYLLLMTYFIMWIMHNPKMLAKINLIHFIIIIIAYIGLFFAIIYTSPQNFILKHILALFYVAVASFLLCMIFQYFDSKAVVSAGILSVILFVILSVLAYNFQNLISSKVSMAFFIVFILMAIAEFIIGLIYPSSMLEKLIILAMLMLICYLVLVKTKRMIENSEKCTMPDYVKESIGFLVSFQNILIRILGLRRGRSRR